MPKRDDGAYNLRKVFEQMELELVQNLRRNLKRHEKEEEKEGFHWEMWQRAKLRNLRKYRKENQKIVDGYSEEIERMIQETLHEEFSRVESFMSRMFEKIRNFFSKRGIRLPRNISSRRQSAAPPNEKDFFGVNKKKLEALQAEAEKGEKGDSIQPEDEREGRREEKPKQERGHEKNDDIAEPEEPYHPEGKEKELTGHTNDAKLDSMTEQVAHDLKEAQKAVWRNMDDIYRRTIYKAEMNMAAGAKTLDQAIDMATKEFLEAGINCIEYRNGRRINIASYAEMALRTASQRATLLAEGKKRDEWGVHTVVVTAHANTCPLCAPWQGKALVDDVYCHGTAEEAKELDVPLLSTAMKAGLLHPNCRHTISTYFPGITRHPAVPDTEKAIETYKAEQKQRALERKIRKWKRIAAGSMEPEKVTEANHEVVRNQKELREHLEKHAELRREYKREKVQELGEPLKGFTGERQEPGARQNQGEVPKQIGLNTVNGLKHTHFATGGMDRKQYANLKRPLGNFQAVPKERVVNVLRKESKQWISSLENEEKRALRKYTYNSGDKAPDRFFERLNAMLRGAEKKNDALMAYAELISGALRKNRLKNDIIGYRTLDIDPYTGYEVGDIFTEPQFISTSVIPGKALDKPYKITLYITKGSKAAYIEPISKFPSQRELLLDRDCTYRVISKHKDSIELEVIP